MIKLFWHRTRRFVYCLVIPALLAPLLILWMGLQHAPVHCAVTDPGIIDLRGCHFDQGDVYKLDGEWEFYWNMLLEPGDALPARGTSGSMAYMPVPAQWLLLGQSDDRSRHGYATYRVRLLIPEDGRKYGIKITNIRTASRIFIDGSPLGSSGLPGRNAEATIPDNRPYTVSFVDHDGEVELLVQVANFTYFSSGISESLYIGDIQSIRHLVSRNEAYDIGIVGSMVIMAFYFLGQGFQRGQNRAFIYLSLLCFAGAFYLITHSEKLLYSYVPNISYEMFTGIQAISTVIGMWALAGYTHCLVRRSLSAWVFRLSSLLTILLTTFTLLFKVPIYSMATPLILVNTSMVSAANLFFMFRMILEKAIGAIYLFFAMLSASIFVVILVANIGWEMSMYAYPPVAFPIFVLCLGMFLSARANHAFLTVHRLSEELSQRDKEKDEFLSRTSNELRTPLKAIVHISRSMADGVGGQLSKNHRDDAILIEQMAKRLSALVNDILDFERMKSGAIALDWKSVDLSRIVDVVLEVFRYLNLGGKVRIVNLIPPHTSVRSDENRLTQILFNLIENSLKLMVEGTVKISALEEAGRTHVSIELAGAGTSEWPETDRSMGDGGLGLSISRLLVRLHGGELRFDSDAAQGACYTFSVPSAEEVPHAVFSASTPSGDAEAAAPNDPAVAARPATDQSLSAGDVQRYRILIVDNYVHAKALMNLLAKEDYETFSVASGQEALRWLSTGGTCDLCVMDVLIPGMSGFALCREIRRFYSPLDLPVLMMTSDTSSRMNETGLAAGANDFIIKPYELGDLIARVRTLVQLKRSVSQTLDSEIAALRAQIKPHFLYNAINTIIWMSKRDVEQTRQLLRNLSDFLRGSFDFGNRESLVPFKSELRLIRAYLSLEKARFGGRLTDVYDLQTTDFLLPPLLVQPLVENAVRHGILEKVDGGTVFISVSVGESIVVIEVADDGVGMTAEQIESWATRSEALGSGRGTNIGLSNVNRRLVRQFGQTLRIAERPGGGTIVTLHIPLIMGENPNET